MIGLWAASFVCALGYWGYVLRAPSHMRSALKTLSVLGLSGIAAASGQVLLASALAFCAAGDACLSRDGEKPFLAGVAAFAFAHLVYVAVFWGQPQASMAHLITAPRLYSVMALLGVGVVMALAILPRAGDLRVPVAIYIPVILAMGFSALAWPQAGPVVIGAVCLFILSDCLLALETFVFDGDQPLIALLVWPLYWAAQALFLWRFTGVPQF